MTLKINLKKILHRFTAVFMAFLLCFTLVARNTHRVEAVVPAVAVGAGVGIAVVVSALAACGIVATNSLLDQIQNAESEMNREFKATHNGDSVVEYACKNIIQFPGSGGGPGKKMLRAAAAVGILSYIASFIAGVKDKGTQTVDDEGNTHYLGYDVQDFSSDTLYNYFKPLTISYIKDTYNFDYSDNFFGAGARFKDCVSLDVYKIHSAYTSGSVGYSHSYFVFIGTPKVSIPNNAICSMGYIKTDGAYLSNSKNTSFVKGQNVCYKTKDRDGNVIYNTTTSSPGPAANTFNHYQALSLTNDDEYVSLSQPSEYIQYIAACWGLALASKYTSVHCNDPELFCHLENPAVASIDPKYRYTLMPDNIVTNNNYYNTYVTNHYITNPQPEQFPDLDPDQFPELDPEEELLPVNIPGGDVAYDPDLYTEHDPGIVFDPSADPYPDPDPIIDPEIKPDPDPDVDPDPDTGLFEWLKTLLNNILDAIKGLVDALINALKGLLTSLFVPTVSVQDHLQQLANNYTTGFKSSYLHIEEVTIPDVTLDGTVYVSNKFLRDNIKTFRLMLDIFISFLYIVHCFRKGARILGKGGD